MSEADWNGCKRPRKSFSIDDPANSAASSKTSAATAFARDGAGGNFPRAKWRDILKTTIEKIAED